MELDKAYEMVLADLDGGNSHTLEKAYELVLADLEDRNSHTIGRLLHWDWTGQNDEIMYRAWLSAKNLIEAYELDNPRD